MTKLTKEKREDLPDSHFGVPETKQLPMNDETHTRLAWDMVDRTHGLTDEQRSTARERIKRRAHELGIDTSEWGDKQQAMRCFTAMALNMPDISDHPNKAPFKGILCRIDEPSDSPPGGAKGRRAYISKAVAEKALPTLLGMAVDTTANFDGHNEKNKIGIITSATIEGNAIVVEGFLYSGDFPEETKRIKAEKNYLGMSYEATGYTHQEEGNIVVFDSCAFTGAAILYKDLAAYTTTSLAASAAQQEPEKEEMSTKEKEDLLAQVADLAKKVDELQAKQADTSNVTAASVSHLVKPHSDAIRSAASSMCAAGIGNHAKEGHGAILHRMADNMDAEAAMGKIPHIYRDHDYLNGASDKSAKSENNSAEMVALKAEIGEIKTLMVDLKKERFAAAAEPERKTLSPAVSALLQKHNLSASQDSEGSSMEVVNAAFDKTKMTTAQRIAAKLEMRASGVLK